MRGGSQHRLGSWFAAAALGLLAPGCPSSSEEDGPKRIVETCEKGAWCGSSCVNLSKSVDHCGACGLACNSTELCSNGMCVVTCPVWAAVCGNYCADLRKDREDCGDCGIACKDGEVCSAGNCAKSCEEGTEECDGTCSNYMEDCDSCGSCGSVCGQGEVCSNGGCALSCQAALTECEGLCVNLKTSRQNCGACGRACGAGWVCSDGVCSLSCQAGLSECNGTCVNKLSDNAHCGGCKSVCGPGQICSGGVCEVNCQRALTECEGTCVNTERDGEHCGGCSNECAEGEVCAGGACAMSCGNGLVECEGSCVETSYNPKHCGGCGKACPSPPHAKAACLSGRCEYVCEAGRYDGDGVADNGCESSRGSGGSAGMGGDPCLSADHPGCDDGNPCTVDECVPEDGSCSTRPAAGGIPCGDGTTSACTRPDSCDGLGSCDPRHEPLGAPCGDQDRDCAYNDACDGTGACQDNGLVPAGTPCGDPSENPCTAADRCDATGVCLANDNELLPFANSGLGGDGLTADSAYLICNPEQFINIEIDDAHRDYFYELGRDLSFVAYGNNAFRGLTSFRGQFDGKDFAISDYAYNQPSASVVGLFGSINGADIKNLVLRDCTIVGANTLGCLAADDKLSTVDNVSVVGASITGGDSLGALVGSISSYGAHSVYTNIQIADTVVDGKNWVGGLAGSVSYGHLRDSHIVSTVTCSGSYCGGVLGEQYRGDLERISGSVTVRCVGYDCGGLAGLAKDNIRYIDLDVDVRSFQEGSPPAGINSSAGGIAGMHCYTRTLDHLVVRGTVHGVDEVGGLFGSSCGDGIYVNSSSFRGTVIGESGVGGLFGDGYRADTSQSYAVADVVGVNQVGGLFGNTYDDSFGPIVKDNYFRGTVTGVDSVGGLAGVSRRPLELTNNYVSAAVKGDTKVGSLIGSLDHLLALATCTSNYVEVRAGGPANVVGGGVDGAIADVPGQLEKRTPAQMLQQSTYVGFDFGTIWAIEEGVSLPTFRASDY